MSRELIRAVYPQMEDADPDGFARALEAVETNPESRKVWENLRDMSAKSVAAAPAVSSRASLSVLVKGMAKVIREKIVTRIVAIEAKQKTFADAERVSELEARITGLTSIVDLQRAALSEHGRQADAHRRHLQALEEKLGRFLNKST